MTAKVRSVPFRLSAEILARIAEALDLHNKAHPNDPVCRTSFVREAIEEKLRSEARKRRRRKAARRAEAEAETAQKATRVAREDRQEEEAIYSGA